MVADKTENLPLLAADDATLEYVFGKLSTLVAGTTRSWEDNDVSDEMSHRTVAGLLVCLVKDCRHAESILARHHTALVPYITAVLSQLWRHRSGGPPTVAADITTTISRFIYFLTVPQANHAILLSRDNAMLALTLQRIYEQQLGGNHVIHFTTLARINLLCTQATTGLGGGELKYTESYVSSVFGLLRDGVASPEGEELYMALVAMRFHSARKENRAEYWTLYSSGFLQLMIKALKLTLNEEGDFMPDALENGLYVLVDFASESGGPRDAMRGSVHLRAITSLADRASETSASAGKIGKLLLSRLKDGDEAAKAVAPEATAGATTSSKQKNKKKNQQQQQQGAPSVAAAAAAPPPAPRMTADPFMIEYCKTKNWDGLLAGLPRTTDIANLLGMAITLGAPMRVIEALVVDKRADVNEPGMVHALTTPLAVALLNSNSAVALLLIDHGADVNKPDGEGQSALMLSCQFPGLLPVTRRLVQDKPKSGIDLNYANAQLNGNSALHMCIKQERGEGFEQARCLLEAGAAVEQGVGPNRQLTPLAHALYNQDVPMVRLLLKHGADVVRSEEHARMVLHEPSTLSNAVLDQLVDIFVAQDEATACHLYAMESAVKSPSLFAQMYSMQQDSGDGGLSSAMLRWLGLGANVDEALAVAAKRGRIEDVALFLQLGANPNPPNIIVPSVVNVNNGSVLATKPTTTPPPLDTTPLYCALVSDGPDREAIARLLIKAGAKVDVGGDGGAGLLTAAIGTGSVALVTLLLQAGASKKSMLQVGKAAGFKSLLPLLAADDGSSSIKPVACGGFDEGGSDGLGFVFTLCASCRTKLVGLQPCSGCIMVAYCDEECQRAHWPKHKKICKKKREEMDKRMSKA